MASTTVTQASEFLGIGKATVSSYMSGARVAKASFLQKIADAYQVDVLWLMGYNVPKYKDDTVEPVANPTDSQVKAAFFNGADPDLTPEEMDEMWAEAKAYINFKIQQRRSKLN